MTTRYRQPRRINAVSISLALVLGLATWGAVSAWPIVAVNTRVKSELEEALPKAWRANLLPEPTSSQAIAEVREALVDRCRQAGAADPDLDVVITRGEKKISIQARYQASFVLKGTGKTYPVAMRPRAETDSARVEW